MKSPFPGMDPYLQEIWGEVHHSLMGLLKNQVQRQLPSGLWARVEETVTIDFGWLGDPEYARPDISVTTHKPWDTSGESAPFADIAVAEPAVVMDVDVDVTERHIEIVDTRKGHQVVTVIEVLSPSNKISRAGRDKYQSKQARYLESGANLVEIDLIRGGDWVIAAPQHEIAAAKMKTWVVSVFRAANHKVAVYPIGFQEPLPCFRVALRETDQDVVLNLQKALEQSYEDGRYEVALDYSQPPTPPLQGDEIKWVAEILG